MRGGPITFGPDCSLLEAKETAEAGIYIISFRACSVAARGNLFKNYLTK